MYSPVLSTMIAGAFRDPAPAPREFSLLNLKSGQSLTIRYKSIGCSHHYSYRFVFTAHEVVIYALDTPGKIGTPRKLGTHRLTDEERIRLDRLFVFYAGKTKGGCPTVDTIRFTKRDGTQRVRTTTYVDATGSTLNRREMLPLPNLAGRLLSKHPG